MLCCSCIHPSLLEEGRPHKRERRKLSLRRFPRLLWQILKMWTLCLLAFYPVIWRATVAQGWFTLATKSEVELESEAQGALRFSVNQKSRIGSEVRSTTESESEGSEEFFFFWSHFCHLWFSGNKVNSNGSGSGIISKSKSSLPVPFKLRASKNRIGSSRGKTGRGCETPTLYDKSSRDFNDKEDARSSVTRFPNSL